MQSVLFPSVLPRVHKMATKRGDEPSFGEIIDKSLFEESMEIAYRSRNEGESVFNLHRAYCNALSGRQDWSCRSRELEKAKYVFITIYNGHASIVVVDRELFDSILCPPGWGQMIDGPTTPFRKDFEAAKIMIAKNAPRQYHVTLDASQTKYILTWNLYYMYLLKESRSFYVDETTLSYEYLEALCLTVVPSKYQLIMNDCLEFAKRFAWEIAIENGVRETDVKALFRTIAICEQHTSATMEQSSRNNPKSGSSGAISYFTSFRLWLLWR